MHSDSSAIGLKSGRGLERLVDYAAFMFGATSLIRLITFAVSMLGARTRPKDAFGDYGTYVLVYTICQGLFIFGANQTIQRFAARDEAARVRFARIALTLFGALLGVFTIAAIVAGSVSGRLWLSLSLFGTPFVVLWWWARYLARSQL